MHWDILSFFDENNKYRHIAGEKKTIDLQTVEKILSGKSVSTNKTYLKEAVYVYQRKTQRAIVEALIIAEDTTVEEIAELVGMSKEAVEFFQKVFFRANEVFLNKLDLIDYIENKTAEAAEENDSSKLESFLLKRWANALGKRFIIWRYKLKPMEYSPSNMMNVLIEESFFYHQEKAMGNSNIDIREYLGATSLLIRGIKEKQTIKNTNASEDIIHNIAEELGINIENRNPLKEDETIDGLGYDEKQEFVNNATLQE